MAEQSEEAINSDRATDVLTKLEEAKKYKKDGNAHFKAGELKQAVGKYHRSLLYVRGLEENEQKLLQLTGISDTCVELSEEVQSAAQDLRVDCYNNLAACLLQYPEPPYTKIVQYCDKVLEVQPHSTKALFRKGRALYHLKDIDAAAQVLRIAQQQPEGQKDPNIRKYITLCVQEESKQDAKLKATYKDMFSKLFSEQTT